MAIDPAAPLFSARGFGVPAPGREGRPLLLGPIDLELHAGECLGLLGPSGSGKTTALRVLAGLEARAVGELRFEGRAIAPAEFPAFRRQLLYLPQRAPVFPGTGRASLEHMARFASARSSGTPLDPGHADALAETLGLPTTLLDQPLFELSVGENQRVSLLRALLIAPRVLLLDEPSSALDPKARALAEAAILAWLGAGSPTRAAVLVSHDPDERARLCHREQTLEPGG